jgi:ring-1,2-phenylacetyl-CoA epoxidase subunit PaaC
MSEHTESAYEGLFDADDGARWAFGTGFEDPLAGVDQTVPAGVDRGALAGYCLALGDDALVLSHRLQQWVTRLPELEEETAVANIALDLLGQARLLLARAGGVDGSGRSEDDLAFLRDQHEYRNVRLVEPVDGDFADLVARLLVFACWRYALFERLRESVDPVVAAIAEKGAKELAYHRDYAARWVVRLGDGTTESHERMQRALERLWPLVGEVFEGSVVEQAAGEVAVDPATVRAEVDAGLDQVLAAAGLERPDVAPMARIGGRAGRDGVHTEALGRMLAELQSVARAHPGATW